MAYEASEIMMAAAFLFTNKELDEAAESLLKMANLMVKAKKKIQSTKIVEFGNATIERGFLELMDADDPKKLKDLAAGISAAIGVREYIAKRGDSSVRRRAPTIYMTGNVWPKDVEKFKIDSPVMKDYNSADVIVTADKKTFFGLSLKKKDRVTATDPTLINKAFGGILQGKQFDKLREDLEEIRINYFVDVVKEAVKKGIIDKTDIKNYNSVVRSNPQELFFAKQKDKQKFGKRAYINTKGYARSPKGYLDTDTKDPNSMRFFVNKKLAEKNNKLWDSFIKAMNKNAKLFADTLLNIILKTELFDRLKAADIKGKNFDFALVTGIANMKKDSVEIGKADILPLEATLCGLSRIEKNNELKEEKFVLAPYKVKDSDSAKVFLLLKRGNLNILDLELRYKGEFSSQPQFQATIHPMFKSLIKKECGL